MYLRLHIKESEKMYEKYELQFNTLVMQHYPKVKKVMQKNGKPKMVPEYTEHTLKGTHRTTVNYILRAYYAHLNALRNAGQPLDTPFEVSSEALAVMKGCSRFTIIRHINRLQNLSDDGRSEILKTDKRKKIFKDFQPFIIQKKPSGQYFTIALNPKYLVAETNYHLTKFLVDKRPDLVKNDLKKGEYSISVKPTFDIFFPLIIAKCNTLAIQDTLENSNMRCGIPPTTNALLLNVPTKSRDDQKHENGKQGSISTISANASAAGNNLPLNKNFPGADNDYQKKFSGGSNQDSYGRKLDWYIQRGLHFLMLVLYDKTALFGNKLNLTIQLIHQYFSGAISYQTKFEEFMQIVMLTKKYIQKHPEWEHPPAWIWLDPTNKGGIKGAEKYYLGFIIPQRKKRKDYYENLHILSRCIRIYTDQPGIETYRTCTKWLGRRQKGYLLDVFNEIVIDKNKFNQEIFIRLKQNHSEQKQFSYYGEHG